MSWLGWVGIAVPVYCVGFVVTFALQVRFCRRRGNGHRYPLGYGDYSPCNHWTDLPPLAWVWPLVLVVGVAAGVAVLPFIGPVWAVRTACLRIERRLVARSGT